MFVGHYSAAFAAKSLDRRLPLWCLFLAVQFLDLLWGAFVFSGIEKARVDPTINASLPLDLYYMPYSHSLIAALLWSVAVAAGCYLFSGTRSRLRLSVVLGSAVLSHWLLDLLVHSPDLPLFGDAHKLGLGLWNYVGAAFVLELVLLFAGIWAFTRSKEVTRRVKYIAYGFGCMLGVVHCVAMFWVKPPSFHFAVLMFQAFYITLALSSAYLDRFERSSTVARSVAAGS